MTTAIVVMSLKSWCRLAPVFLLLVLYLFAGVSSLRGQGPDDPRFSPQRSPQSTSLKEVDTKQGRRQGRYFRADVDVVLVPVSVTDTFNRPITYLTKQNFAVYEDGEAQEIKYFHQEDTPLSIGILLDTSGSMKTKFHLAREALTQFFKNANRDDDYFVITYSTRPKMWVDSTKSIEWIEEKLQFVEPEGFTPLLDAIYLGLSTIKQGSYGKRALLIISDGGDNYSRYRAREIRELVLESDVQIYALAVFSPFSITYEDWAGKKLLSQIAETSGGRADICSNWEALPDIAANMSRALRSEYLLGYKPTNTARDGKIRKITIRVDPPRSDEQLQVYYKRKYLARTK